MVVNQWFYFCRPGVLLFYFPGVLLLLPGVLLGLLPIVLLILPGVLLFLRTAVFFNLVLLESLE